MTKIFTTTFLMLFTLILIGCSPEDRDRETQVPVATKLSAQSTPMSATSLATNTAMPSVTPTTAPTLSVEDARITLVELLLRNGECRLPCLWGIYPGQSTNEDAKNVLMPLSGLSDWVNFDPAGGAIFPTYTEGDRMLDIDIGFNVDIASSSNTVTKIGFRARELRKIAATDNGVSFEPIFDSTIFGKRLDFYMLHSVLTNHGRPDAVLLGTLASVPPRQAPGNFHVLLLYPEQGMLIEYTTEMLKLGSSVRGCPANAHVEMDLFPSGDANAFFTRLESTNGEAWAVKQNWYQPLEETTSLTLDEFYEVFRMPTDQCIETLASLWPTPDP